MTNDQIAVFASNVAKARAKARLSQAQLSARAGIHSTEISRIERGHRDPRLSTLIRLAHGLKVKVGRLLEGV